MTPKYIIKKLETNKKQIRRYRVKRIGLFGSFLKHKQRRGSDLDFLVSFKEPTFDNYIELKFLLERMFRKKVDLVVESNLKPALEYVKEEAVYAKGL